MLSLLTQREQIFFFDFAQLKDLLLHQAKGKELSQSTPH
jgi:hypothetical protein